jgi:transposase-like protein
MARAHFDKSKECFWRRVVQRWQRSGQTIRAFCRTHRLSEPSFYAWRRTLAERDQQQADAAGSTGLFAPVQLIAAAPPLEVVCRGGRLVRVAASFDAAALRAVVAALEELPC